MSDREAVYALARSFLDWLPGPKISRHDPVRAEAATVSVKCSICHGRGERRIRGFWTWCDRCDGSGWTKADAYTEREISDAPELPIDVELQQHFALMERDPAARARLRTAEQKRNDRALAEFARLDAIRTGEYEVGEVGEDHIDWDAAFARRDKQFDRGSYRELDQAQHTLERKDPARWRLWWQLVLVQQPVLISTLARSELDGTADLLAEWMPRPLRLPVELRPNEHAHRALWHGHHQAHRQARRERKQLVVELAQEGLSSGQIALHPLVALSAGRVRQILVGLTPVTVATAA